MNEDKLNKLCDISEIQMLKSRYCAVADGIVKDPAKAAAGFKEIFTEDVTADYGMGEMKGREAVLDFQVNAIGSAMQQLWHSTHTPLVEVTGDTATGRWTGILRSKPKGADEVGQQCGYYIDAFRRTPSGWRISAVRFVGEG